MSEVHYIEMQLKSPLDRAIWNGTKNIAVWRTDVSPGSAKLDYEKTLRAKKDAEEIIRKAFQEAENKQI
jgi:hypothetical protein